MPVIGGVADNGHSLSCAGAQSENHDSGELTGEESIIELSLQNDYCETNVSKRGASHATQTEIYKSADR